MELRALADGVEVIFGFSDDVKPRRGVRGSFRFGCRCGVEDIVVSVEDVRSGEGAAAFQAVRRDVELTREWNRLQERAKGRRIDFLEYEADLGLWKERRRIRADHSTSKYSTGMVARCPACNRAYRLTLIMENPLKALSAIGPLEAFRHLGIDERKHRDTLARTAFAKGFENGGALLRYLNSLSAERDKMEDLLNQLRGLVQDAQQEEGTQFTSSQLKLLDTRLREAAAEYTKKNERLLLNGLNAFTRPV